MLMHNKLFTIAESMDGGIVQDVSETLHKQYKASRFSVEEYQWPPYQPKHYTTLALVHHKDKPTDTKIFTFNKAASYER